MHYEVYWYSNLTLSYPSLQFQIMAKLGIQSFAHTRDASVASPDGSAVWGVVVSTRWWLLVNHCVLRNWGRILVRAVKGLISRAGMVSICPLLWQRDVKLQQTKPKLHLLTTLVSPKSSKCNISISNGPIAFKFYTEVKYLKLHKKNGQWLD